MNIQIDQKILQVLCLFVCGLGIAYLSSRWHMLLTDLGQRLLVSMDLLVDTRGCDWIHQEAPLPPSPDSNPTDVFHVFDVQVDY